MDESLDSPPLWGPRTRLIRTNPPKTLAGSVANRLRHDIITGRLRPGERLHFDKVKKAYDVGISPLREALVQLTADGLVVNEGHKGFSVAPVLLDEMLDVLELRVHMETLALRKSIARGDEEWEVKITAAYYRLVRATAQLDSAGADQRKSAEDDWERRHREFHFALTGACDSQWLLHFCDRLYDQIERYRRHYWEYPDRAHGADAEHERLKEAAINRETEAAVSLLAEHFHTQAELTARVIREREAAAGE